MPSHINITSIDFEGPVVVIYTQDMEAFASNNDIVRQLAQGLRRRVAIRPDPSMLADPDSVEKRIREIIPRGRPDHRHLLRARDRRGHHRGASRPAWSSASRARSSTRSRRRSAGPRRWSARRRYRPRPSPRYATICARCRTSARTSCARSADVWPDRSWKGETWMRMTALGGFREVGRICTHCSPPGRARSSSTAASTPSDSGQTVFQRAGDPAAGPIDAVVITHAHLDHCGLLPALYKYGVRRTGLLHRPDPGPDVAAAAGLHQGLCRREQEGALTSPPHVREMVKHCIPLKYGETTDIAPDIRLTFQNAGHILGSAVCHFHIGDGLYNIAFTGDMKFERTWLFNATVNKFPRLETLIIESTYGGYHDIQPSRTDAANAAEGHHRAHLGQEGQGRRAGLRRRAFPGGHAGASRS